jgi:hypothetical protein
MTRLPRLWRAFAVGLVAAATTVSMTQVASAEPAPPVVPGSIAPDAGNKVFLVGHTKKGESFQIYKCTAPGTWSLDRPSATLVGDNGQLIATHFKGPTWQATDGSKVVGTPVANVPNPGSIPLLLLKGTPTPVGGDGGRLGATTFIQRVNTTGGVIPAASECTEAAAAAGTEKKVEYSADYYFWKATGKP